jgi:tripartite ATP-independent transporter DctM subunit
MTPIMTGVVGLCSLLALLVLGMPIGFAMLLLGFGGFAYLATFSGAVNTIVNVPFNLISGYDYAVLPLFIFMASLCLHSGLGQSLFRMAHAWLGRIPGGLSIATLGSCAVFGAASASSIATTVTIGTVALPEMRRYDYDDRLAVGSVAAGGTLGTIIPPSGMLMIYGIIAQQDIGDLFVAGILPGIVLTIMFVIMVAIWVRINPKLAPLGPRTSMITKLKSILDSLEMLLLIALVIGGLIVGWFTPTEAGAMGAVGAIVLSLARRRLTIKALRDAAMDTIRTAGMIFTILIGALVFTRFLAITTIPMQIAEWVGGLGLSPTVVMILILLIYLLLGTFLEEMAMILLTLPIFLPLVDALGFDLIWFGIIIMLVVIMGMISPPVGITMFVVKGIVPEVPMGTIYKGVLPFWAVSIVFTGILLAFPDLALILPGIVG